MINNYGTFAFVAQVFTTKKSGTFYFIILSLLNAI